MHCVKCLYCGKTFDIDSEEFIKPNSIRYAHISCYKKHQEEEKLKNDKKHELTDYIINLFNLKGTGPVINKELKTYRTENGYTDEGILNALKYFYEVKKGDKSKANNHLGIVPFIYNEAQEYFNSIDRINKLNIEIMKKNKFEYEVEKITIPSPQRQERKRNLFSFLDEEEMDGK